MIYRKLNVENLTDDVSHDRYIYSDYDGISRR